MTSLILLALPAVFVLGFVLGRALERRRRPTLAAAERRALRTTVAYWIAIHEAGHAVCVWRNPYTSMITEVVIDEDRRTGHVAHQGAVSTDPDYLWHHAVGALGGIAAEVKEFRKFKSGPAESDLIKAAGFARALVAQGATLPPWGNLELHAKAFDLSTVFRSVKAGSPEAHILNLAYDRAKYLVTQDRERLYRVAEDLTVKGVLTKADIACLFGFRIPIPFR